MTKALFIGRFQPFHLGHMSVVMAVAKENELLYIGIGSTNVPVSKHNPFSVEERELMINGSLKGKIKNYKIYRVPDIGNNSRWVKHVESIVPKFDIVYSGSPLIRKLFREKNYEVRCIPAHVDTSSTQIREMMYAGEDWEHLVSEGTLNVLKKINGKERVSSLMNLPAYGATKISVDAIIKYKDSLVLIKRKNYPFQGMLAFPGGHLNYGETCEEAVVREAKEETGLNFKIEKLSGIYSDPDKDPRGHYVNLVYVGEGAGELKAGDDAAEVLLVPIEDARKGLSMAFDHARMLKEAFDLGMIKMRCKDEL